MADAMPQGSLFFCVQALGLDSMATSRHWAVLPCSAKKGTGLLEGMSWLVSDIANKVFVRL